MHCVSDLFVGHAAAVGGRGGAGRSHFVVAGAPDGDVVVSVGPDCPSELAQTCADAVYGGVGGIAVGRLFFGFVPFVRHCFHTLLLFWHRFRGDSLSLTVLP